MKLSLITTHFQIHDLVTRISIKSHSVLNEYEKSLKVRVLNEYI